MKHRISSIMSHTKKQISLSLLAACLFLTLCAGTVFSASTTDFAADPDSDTEEYWAAVKKAEEETLKETIASFNETFSNQFNKADFSGMTITYDEKGIPTVDAPAAFAPKETAVTALVKHKKRPLYTTAACGDSSLFFYIPKGKTVKIIDSYPDSQTVKIQYAGKTGYIKKSHLNF